MEDSKTEIMEATYKALCKYGYADLTIEKIAEESEKGKSLIYYHFDDKEALILEFLEFMTCDLEEELSKIDAQGDNRVEKIIGLLLAKDDDMWEFHKALIDIQGRAQFNEELAEKFAEIDEMLEKEIKEALQAIEIDDPEFRAEMMLSTIQGVLNRKLTLDDRKGLEKIKEDLIKSIE